jgi:hypothetical protein
MSTPEKISRGQAYAAARAKYGPKAIFEWTDPDTLVTKKYTTENREEKAARLAKAAQDAQNRINLMPSSDVAGAGRGFLAGKPAGAENIYLGRSPKKFLQLLSNKESLTADLIDFCSSVKVQAALSVTWVLDKEIYPEERTLFIPQSMTHEWGHFIVEFEPYHHQSKTQLCHVLFLIHEEEPQTEDLGSKIKLMKRVIDRVFPDVEKHITKEFLRFDEEMLMSDVKESALEQLGFDYPHLKFLGQVSPVEASYSNEKYLSRTLLSY